MENNQGNNRKPRKPEGDRPKNGFITPLLIALALVLAFSWISNTIEKSQYKESTIADFWEARESGHFPGSVNSLIANSPDKMIISLRTISEVEVPYFRHFSFKLLFTCCVR